MGYAFTGVIICALALIIVSTYIMLPKKLQTEIIERIERI